MGSDEHPPVTIGLRLPVIVMVLAATAVPIELRRPALSALDFRLFASDVIANVAGYVPVGLVLGAFPPGRVLLVAGILSAFAETSQLVMVHRDPSVVDLATNLVGAAIGMAVGKTLGLSSVTLRLNRWNTFGAALLACALLLGEWSLSPYPPSSRGISSPGRLEASWKLDEAGGRAALDSSTHGLQGRFSTEPTSVDGPLGRAVRLNGPTDYVDFGRSTALRLVGSMTISAWINSSSFPFNDAAIVSSYNGLGYQLDTTDDSGPRTIGFKLTDRCGNVMARYGATPLVVDQWYHVAGVYNAEAKTLDVYLNGKLDNGRLRGAVTGTQRSSRERVYVGRRADSRKYGFAGALSDVRIFSRPLTKAEIAAVRSGEAVKDDFDSVPPTVAGLERGSGAERQAPATISCASESDAEDAQLPASAAVLGVLVAIACAGLWPSSGALLSLFVSVGAGLLLLPASASTLPTLGRCLIVFASLAGAASVAAGRSNSLSDGVV